MEYRNLGKAGVTMSWPERAAGGSAISTPLRLRVCWPKSHPAGPQGLVDILVGDRALAPAAVGAMVTGDDGRAVRQTPGGSGGASPASLHGWRVLGAAGASPTPIHRMWLVPSGFAHLVRPLPPLAASPATLTKSYAGAWRPPRRKGTRAGACGGETGALHY